MYGFYCSTQLIYKLNLSNTLVIASTDTHSTGTAQIHRMFSIYYFNTYFQAWEWQILLGKKK